MTFPDRNLGGSGLYARSLLSALRRREDLEVAEISSQPPGLGRTMWWLSAGARESFNAAGGDLLHCPSFVTPWRIPKRFVVTVLDLSTRRFPADHPAEWRAYERWVVPQRARAAAAVITISEVTRQDAIREYGLPPDRVVTIYPGIDERFFKQPDSMETPARDLAEPRLIFPGAPVARKNLDLVLRAMAEAPPSSPLGRACLQITGASAATFPAHVERIEQMGLGRRVEWLGQVPAEQLPSVMRNADVCVYPSFYEGFGFPPLEAMAAGTPVVASTASCLPEILGDAALLVDPTDLEGFTRSLQSLLGDPATRNRLTEAGRQRALSFTWDRCAAQTAALYHDVLARAA
jgi:glycosyltransferase involved in cell wall biosynthesis